MITPNEYNRLIKIPPESRTQEMNDKIFEFDRASVNAPSKEEIAQASRILKIRDPLLLKELEKSGRGEKWALDIMAQDRYANTLLREQGKTTWVRPVKEVPDDVPKEYGFKFNWKSAYDESAKDKGERPLKATEADAKKLRKYIEDHMYELGESDDPELLMKMAQDLHLWKPDPENTSDSWENFIKSDKWKQFQDYLEDVRKYQHNKELDKIWNDGSVGSMALNFAFPVTAEYAKKNYENIDGIGDLVGPMAFDVGANVAMTGSRAPGINKVFGAPVASFFYDTFSAPAITEVGNLAFNDEDLKTAGTQALMGGMTNMGITKALPRIGGFAKSQIEKKMNGEAYKAQKLIDDAVNEAQPTIEKIYGERALMPFEEGSYLMVDKKRGIPFIRKGESKNVLYTTKPDEKKASLAKAKKEGVDLKYDEVKPITEAPVNVPQITQGEYDKAAEASQFQRRGILGNKTSELGGQIKKNQDKIKEMMSEADMIKFKTTVMDKLKKGQKPTISELRLAGYNPGKESYSNWVKRFLTENLGLAIEYGGNALGRPSIGNRAWNRFTAGTLPSSILKYEDPNKLDSPKWYEYYGLSDWNK